MKKLANLGCIVLGLGLGVGATKLYEEKKAYVKGKKALIVTWFRACNYGQVLQAYAMSEIFKHLGYEVYLLDYEKLDQKGTINHYIVNYKKCKFLENPLRKIYFESFVFSRIKSTKPCNSMEEVRCLLDKEKYDLFVCGSDQVWNPERYDPILYLDFGDDYKARKMSYAASLICEEQVAYYQKTFDKIKRHIEKIDYISVREDSGCRIIESLINKKVEHVLDPTLLLNDKMWMRRLGIKQRQCESYMLCYIMGGSSAHKKQLDLIKRKYNINKVVSVFGVDEVTYGDEIYKDLGPKQFLDLLYNATVVCTDSFHGVAFSVNFEKEFYAFDRRQKTARKKGYAFRNTDRITSLLKVLALEERFIREGDSVERKTICYETVNDKLKKERKKAWKFLNKVKEA